MCNQFHPGIYFTWNRGVQLHYGYWRNLSTKVLTNKPKQNQLTNYMEGFNLITNTTTTTQKLKEYERRRRPMYCGIVLLYLITTFNEANVVMVIGNVVVVKTYVEDYLKTLLFLFSFSFSMFYLPALYSYVP